MWNAQITNVPSNVAENPNVRVTFYSESEVFTRDYTLASKEELTARITADCDDLNALAAQAEELQKEVQDLPIEVVAVLSARRAAIAAQAQADAQE